MTDTLQPAKVGTAYFASGWQLPWPTRRSLRSTSVGFSRELTVTSISSRSDRSYRRSIRAAILVAGMRRDQPLRRRPPSVVGISDYRDEIVRGLGSQRRRRAIDDLMA